MQHNSESALRIGTRGSALALWQAETVQALIAEKHPDLNTSLVVIKPEGDVDKHSPLRAIGGRGVFTSALQQRMLADEIDLAVHSTKDLPSLAPHGVMIAAYPQREDPRDALISRHGVELQNLPANPVIGTSSRRRAAQILKVRPDADIRELRGNIDTRLKKGLSDDFDAVILAAAGLKRMGWGDQITSLLPIEVSCPAPGQGALAVEARPMQEQAWSIAASLDDTDIRSAVAVERAFLRGVGGGCSTPIGAHAVVEQIHGISTVRFWGMLGSDDGTRLERFYAEWPTGQAIDRAFAVADQMMREIASSWAGVTLGESLRDRPILVTGSASQIKGMEKELAARGARLYSMPTIAIDVQPVDVPADTDWLVLTSKHAVPAVSWSLVNASVAVIGEATAEAVRQVGVEPALVSAGPGGDQLADDLINRGIESANIVAVVSDIAVSSVSSRLAAAGANVKVFIGYTNTPVTSVDNDLRERIAAGEMEAVTFASPSSVDAFVQLVGIDLPALSGAAMFAVGPTTAESMREHHLPVHAIAASPSAKGLAVALEQYFGGEESQS